jgi:hypothetical protein
MTMVNRVARRAKQRRTDKALNFGVIFVSLFLILSGVLLVLSQRHLSDELRTTKAMYKTLLVKPGI